MIKWKTVCAIILLIALITGTVASTEVMPRADIVFESATAFLAYNKLAVFDCIAYDIYDRIAITLVWLEQDINGQWIYVKTLPPPTYVAVNMPAYGAEVSYSSYIGTGTFRIGFTVDADGYSISRYSNSRTF